MELLGLEHLDLFLYILLGLDSLQSVFALGFKIWIPVSGKNWPPSFHAHFLLKHLLMQKESKGLSCHVTSHER